MLKESKRFLSVANTFSAGIFIAIAFVHVIPEVSRTYYLTLIKQHDLYEAATGEHDDHRRLEETAAEKIQEEITEIMEGAFPLPFVLVLLGYMFILWIDKVLIEHSGLENQDKLDVIQTRDSEGHDLKAKSSQVTLQPNSSSQKQDDGDQPTQQKDKQDVSVPKDQRANEVKPEEDTAQEDALKKHS